jgi:hypothetical protein
MKLLILFCFFTYSLCTLEETPLIYYYPKLNSTVWKPKLRRCTIYRQDRMVIRTGMCKKESDWTCKTADSNEIDNTCGYEDPCVSLVKGYSYYRGICRGEVCYTPYFIDRSPDCINFKSK